MAAGKGALQIEANGINVIAGDERKGRPRDLFWPWFAASVPVLGLSCGSFVLGFLGTWVASRSAVRAQEAQPQLKPATAGPGGGVPA